MDFTPLNDPNSREQRVRKLAENLLQRGLAMTQGSARQLAESMVATERRVQQKFEERKDELERGVSHSSDMADKAISHAPRTSAGSSIGQLNSDFRDNSAKRENTTAMRERAMNPRPVEVQTYYDTPEKEEYPELNQEMSVAEAAAEPVPVEHEAPVEPAEEEVFAPEETKSDETAPMNAVEAEATPEEVVAEEPVESTPEDSPSQEYHGEMDDTAERSPESDPLAEETTMLDQEVVAEVEETIPQEESNIDSAPEEIHPKDETESTPSPEETPAEDDDEESLAKKHGVDLSNIFNVNK